MFKDVKILKNVQIYQLNDAYYMYNILKQKKYVETISFVYLTQAIITSREITIKYYYHFKELKQSG